MANRIMLNETSYHGAGAIEEIANEAKAHGFKKAFVCSDPDLIKFKDCRIRRRPPRHPDWRHRAHACCSG